MVEGPDFNLPVFCRTLSPLRVVRKSVPFWHPFVSTADRESIVLGKSSYLSAVPSSISVTTRKRWWGSLESKRQTENEGRLLKAKSNLEQVARWEAAPRRVRKLAGDAMLVLHDTKLSMTLRAANVITMLEEVTQDPNLPSFVRVALWSAVSELEAISE